MTESLEEELDKDYEVLDETAEEWPEDPADAEPLSAADRAALEREIADLEAVSQPGRVHHPQREGPGALDWRWTGLRRSGTPGRTPQSHHLHRVAAHPGLPAAPTGRQPYADGIVLFNGSNTDTRSRQIYADWLQRHRGTDRVTGSRTADMRSALVDYFRDKAGS